MGSKRLHYKAVERKKKFEGNKSLKSDKSGYYITTFSYLRVLGTMSTNSSTNTINDDAVYNLIKAFFRGSLKHCFRELETITLDKQQVFLDATIRKELLKKYPVNSEFSRIFFKKIIGCLESSQEVHDDFYTHLCFVMKDKRDKDNFWYRHYMIGQSLDDVVTIKETNNMVVNGTTGLRTWEGALILSDWVLCNKKLFTNKQILELGAGVGFTGVTIAKHCSDIHSLLLTDCHDDVLKTICDNVEINFPDICRDESFHRIKFLNGHSCIEVMKLDWNCNEDLTDDVLPDVIIGADIVYDPTIIIPLANIIKTFLTRNKNLEVYIANIIRNQDTYNYFVKTLDSYNFTWQFITHTESVHVEWDQNIEKCLLRIKNT